MLVAAAMLSCEQAGQGYRTSRQQQDVQQVLLAFTARVLLDLVCSVFFGLRFLVIPFLFLRDSPLACAMQQVVEQSPRSPSCQNFGSEVCSFKKVTLRFGGTRSIGLALEWLCITSSAHVEFLNHPVFAH